MTKDEIKRLQEMKDEDIDYSDIPELTDEELKSFRPARDYLKDIARRNRAALARMICDEKREQRPRHCRRGGFCCAHTAA